MVRAVGERVAELHPATPAGPLADLGIYYRGYHLDGFPAGIHRGLPSGMMTFIVAIDEVVDLGATPPPFDGAGRFESLVSGLHTSPAIIHHPGRQIGIHIDIPPTACSAVFGLPAAALASCAVDLAELIGADARRLIDEVRAAPDWAKRFAAVDRALLTVAASRGVGQPRAELRHAWRLLRGAEATLRVEQLAAEIGWSRRHLLNQFRSAFGVSPKQAQRLTRFERAQQWLRRGAQPVAVAAGCGFADQSHLVREWHDFAGLSPAAWLASESD